MPGKPEDMREKEPVGRPTVGPQQCFTIFDLFHFLLPLIAALAIFPPARRSFGLALGLALAGIVGVISFWGLRYAIPASVLFLHRRRWGTPALRHEVACCVVTHVRGTEKGGSDDGKA